MKGKTGKCIEATISLLMDIEDFLLTKKKFADSLDEQKLLRYWNADRKA